MVMRELTNEEFSNFSKNFNIKSLYQSVEYALTMNKQNFDCIYIGLIDGDNILAATLILIEKNRHFKYAYSPRGFLIDYKNEYLLKIFTDKLKKFLSSINVMAIKISPLIIRNKYDFKYKIISKNNYYDNIFTTLKNLNYIHLGYNKYFEGLKPRFEAIIKLNVPYYILFKNCKKHLRTKIRSAEKQGVRIYKGDINNLEYLYLQTKKKYPRDLEYFKECYKQFSKSNKVEFFYSLLDTEQYLKSSQKKYDFEENRNNEINNLITASQKKNTQKLITQKMESDALFEQYKKQLLKATKMLRNNPKGIVTASALVIKNEDEAFILMDGYDNNYSNINSKHLLVWKLCERYSKLGYKKMNLGGLADINNPGIYKGLNEFKINFNAIVNEYIGDLELIINNTSYFMYKNKNQLKSILKK